MENNSISASQLPKASESAVLKPWQKIIAGVLIAIIATAFYLVLDANKYEATVRIIEGQGRVGVNPTTERLDFGDMSRGTSAIRRVDLQNGTIVPMYVMIFKIGSISDLMDISKNYFVLAPKENTKIEFNVYIPASAKIDSKYTGRVFLFKIPGPWKKS